jgi:hypothetical protein
VGYPLTLSVSPFFVSDSVIAITAHTLPPPNHQRGGDKTVHLRTRTPGTWLPATFGHSQLVCRAQVPPPAPSTQANHH